jgi:hypothetical protein
MEQEKMLQKIDGKGNEPVVTFFMIVTNRDIFIADASIARFKTVYNKYRETLPFILSIYANGLTEKNYEKFSRKWERFPYVQIKKYVTESKYVPGTVIENFNKTATKLIEGPYKPGAVIWDEELPHISTPYFCTIDADFEILRPEFIRIMIDTLENDKGLAGIATDYTPTQPYFDTYVNNTIIFHQRWNTWCCMYRKEVNNCKESHFARKIIYCDGEHSHDDTGYFQERVQKELGLRFDVLDKRWQKDFIHYGAFSKNRDVRGYLPTLQYRILAQLRKKGISGSGGVIWKYPDLLVKKCAAVIFSYMYNKSVSKRLQYDFSANALDKV